MDSITFVGDGSESSGVIRTAVSLLALEDCWQSLPFLGLQLLNPNFSLHCHMVFSSQGVSVLT